LEVQLAEERAAECAAEEAGDARRELTLWHVVIRLTYAPTSARLGVMDFWTNPSIVFAGAVIAIILLGVIAFRRRTHMVDLAVLAERERERVANETKPCVCGEPATDPAPILRRNRGGWDWLRNYFGAPPRYTREVDGMKPHVFCRSHAHVADELMSQWIFDTRAKYSALNVETSVGAAGFEQEHLLTKVKASLTENQKRATKANQPLRMVPKVDEGTGT